jgi:hypothetical protein
MTRALTADELAEIRATLDRSEADPRNGVGYTGMTIRRLLDTVDDLRTQLADCRAGEATSEATS